MLRKDQATSAPHPSDPIPDHPAISKGRVGLITAQNPRYPAQVPGENDALGQELTRMGLHHERTEGRYEAPEQSFIVHNPTREQLEDLGRRFGQESVVYTDGGKHELIYTNGPNAGQYLPAEGVEIFPRAPEDYYTAVPGPNGAPSVYFRYPFDFSRPLMSRNVAPQAAAGMLGKALKDRIDRYIDGLVELRKKELAKVAHQQVAPHREPGVHEASGSPHQEPGIHERPSSPVRETQGPPGVKKDEIAAQQTAPSPVRETAAGPFHIRFNGPFGQSFVTEKRGYTRLPNNYTQYPSVDVATQHLREVAARHGQTPDLYQIVPASQWTRKAEDEFEKDRIQDGDEESPVENGIWSNWGTKPRLGGGWDRNPIKPKDDNKDKRDAKPVEKSENDMTTKDPRQFAQALGKALNETLEKAAHNKHGAIQAGQSKATKAAKGIKGSGDQALRSVKKDEVSAIEPGEKAGKGVGAGIAGSGDPALSAVHKEEASPQKKCKSCAKPLSDKRDNYCPQGCSSRPSGARSQALPGINVPASKSEGSAIEPGEKKGKGAGSGIAGSGEPALSAVKKEESGMIEPGEKSGKGAGSGIAGSGEPALKAVSKAGPMPDDGHLDAVDHYNEQGMYAQPQGPKPVPSSIPCKTCAGPMNPVMVLLAGASGQCPRCIKNAGAAAHGAGYQKAEDFIDVKNENDPKKRIKTVGPSDTKMPPEKGGKPYKHGSDSKFEGSGGQITKKGEIDAIEPGDEQGKAAGAGIPGSGDPALSAVGKAQCHCGRPDCKWCGKGGVKKGEVVVERIKFKKSAIIEHLEKFSAKPSGVPGAPKPPQAAGAKPAAFKAEPDMAKTIGGLNPAAAHGAAMPVKGTPPKTVSPTPPVKPPKPGVKKGEGDPSGQPTYAAVAPTKMNAGGPPTYQAVAPTKLGDGGAPRYTEIGPEGGAGGGAPTYAAVGPTSMGEGGQPTYQELAPTSMEGGGDPRYNQVAPTGLGKGSVPMTGMATKPKDMQAAAGNDSFKAAVKQPVPEGKPTLQPKPPSAFDAKLYHPAAAPAKPNPVVAHLRSKLPMAPLQNVVGKAEVCVKCNKSQCGGH